MPFLRFSDEARRAWTMRVVPLESATAYKHALARALEIASSRDAARIELADVNAALSEADLPVLQ